MDGFKKIELSEVDEKSASQKYDQKQMRSKISRMRKLPTKTLAIIGGVVALFILLSIFIIILPAQQTYKSAKKTYTQLKLVGASIKAQNITLASDELKKTKEYLLETQSNLHKMSYLKFIPPVNLYYNDADHLMNAGAIGIESGEVVVDSLKPYADVLGLKGAGSFVGGSAEERIKTAVLTMGKITPQVDTLSVSLGKIQKEIDAVDPNHYPELIFGKKVKKQLTQVKELTDQAAVFLDQAKPLVKVLPSLLGEKEEKKYLVLFQNDKELRPTGGFITSFSIFRLDKGVIKVDRQDDIYSLDNQIGNKPPAPAPIKKYLPKVSVLNLRDSNLSPDFIESMNQFNELFNQTSGSKEIDGIIALDTNVLVSTIKILDDAVSAGGITFTTKEDPRCKCPQVIYELEDNISRPVNYVKTDRKGLIGSLMVSIMNKAFSSSPKIYWGPLFQSMLAQVNQKHVLFYLYDKDAQSGIEALNAAGRIQSFDGDYLHINDANFGGQKANLFTSEDAEINYTKDKDGSLTKTITLTYKNTFPPSDCNLERGGLCLNAELRNFLRIYTPKGSVLVSSKGSQVKVTTYEELGKTVFEGFFGVPAEGRAVFTITYKLPFKVKDSPVLPVLIQKQPGTFGHQITIKVNGQEVENFQLFADKKLDLKI